MAAEARAARVEAAAPWEAAARIRCCGEEDAASPSPSDCRDLAARTETTAPIAAPSAAAECRGCVPAGTEPGDDPTCETPLGVAPWIAGRELLRNAGARTGVRLDVVVVLVERLVERRKDLGGQHRIDLFVRRRRLGRRKQRRDAVFVRSLFCSLQELLDLRRQRRKRQLLSGGGDRTERGLEPVVTRKGGGTFGPRLGRGRSTSARRRRGDPLERAGSHRSGAGCRVRARANQKSGLPQQRFDVDGSREKAASVPLERVAAMQRAPRIAEKQDVDPLRSRNRPQARDFVERPFRVDVQQDERWHLHRDARDQERERHVDDRVPLAAERESRACRPLPTDRSRRSWPVPRPVVRGCRGPKAQRSRVSSHISSCRGSRRRSRLVALVRVSPPKVDLPQPPRKFSARRRGT